MTPKIHSDPKFITERKGEKMVIKNNNKLADIFVLSAIVKNNAPFSEDLFNVSFDSQLSTFSV